MRLVVLLALLAACGDNQHGDGVPLVAGHDLTVVAHQDDDLLFMQPDLIEAVRGGRGITIVYVTAGNSNKGTGKANERYAGDMQAYGNAVNDQAWDCGWIEINAHAVQHCRLSAENVSLVFLAYPDGGLNGDLPHGLEALWQGKIASAETIADRTTTYTREQLIDTLAEVIREVQPATLHTLDLSGAYGTDHPDHQISGALTVLALARTQLMPELVAYRGYDTQSEPANKLGSLFADDLGVLAYYESCAIDCGVPCGEACPDVQTAHQIWLARRYAFGFRQGVSGQLMANGQCLTGAGLASCATAPVWTLVHSQLRAGGECLATADDGSIAMATCSDEPAQRFFSDDAGRLWSGLAPQTSASQTAFLRCLAPASDGSVTATACGKTVPTWQWAPQLALTPRDALGFWDTGRSVRLGDIDGDGFADLCDASANGLWCAPGRGDGTFGSATRIDDYNAPLAIARTSLTLGDLDGDGIADACGRDANGVSCALSSDHFEVAQFTSELADAEPASLRIADANGDGVANVCGLAAAGVVCSPGGTSFDSRVRSAWPDPTTLVMPADLDGDHRADWCSLTVNGPACGLDAESALTTDGVPWGFSVKKVVETVPADPALTDIADIDGDGDGDLCAPVDNTIACARSQGHGFGPRTTVAVLPVGDLIRAVWLGDLDGDGRADVCVDLGANIACAKL